MAFGNNTGNTLGGIGQGVERGVSGLVQQLQQQQERERIEKNRREDIERTTQFRNEDRATQQMRWDVEDQRYAQGLIRDDDYRALLLKREDEKNALEEKWRIFNSERDELRWQYGLTEDAEDDELRAAGMSYDRLLQAWDRIPSAAEDEKYLFNEDGSPKTGAALAEAIERMERNEARRAQVGQGLGKSLSLMNKDLDTSKLEFGGYVGSNAGVRVAEAGARRLAAVELNDFSAQRKELQDRWNDPALTDKDSPEGEQLWAEIVALDDKIAERGKLVYGAEYSVRGLEPDRSDPEKLARARATDISVRTQLEPLRLADESGTIARFLEQTADQRLTGLETIGPNKIPIQKFLADYAKQGGLKQLFASTDPKAMAQAFTMAAGMTAAQIEELDPDTKAKAQAMLDALRTFDPSKPDAILNLPVQYRELANSLSASWLEVKGLALRNVGTEVSTDYTRTLKTIAEAQDVRQGVNFLGELAKDGNTAGLAMGYNGFVALAKKEGWDDTKIAEKWAELTTRATDANTVRTNAMKAQFQELQQGELNLETGKQNLKTGEIRNMALIGDLIKSGALYVLSDSNQDAWLRSILPPESANATITAWRAEAKIAYDNADADGKARARLMAAQATTAEVDARVATATEDMQVEDFENRLTRFKLDERAAVQNLFASGAEQFGARWLDDPKTIELAQRYNLNLNPLRETQLWRDQVLKSNAAVAGTEADNAARNQAYREMTTLAATPELALSSAKRLIELGNILGVDGAAFVNRLRQDVILGRTRSKAELDSLLANTAATKRSTELEGLRYNYMVRTDQRDWKQSLVVYNDSRRDAKFNQWLNRATFEKNEQYRNWQKSFTIETDARDSALTALKFVHEISMGERQLDQGARSLLSTELTAIGNQAVNVRAEIAAADEAFNAARAVYGVEGKLGPDYITQTTDANGVTTWAFREGAEARLGDFANSVRTVINEYNKREIGRWNLSSLNTSNSMIIDRLRSLGGESVAFADELGRRTGNTGDPNYPVGAVDGKKIMQTVTARVAGMTPENQKLFNPIVNLLRSNAEGYMNVEGYSTAFAAQVTANILRLPQDSLRDGELFEASATETIANFKKKGALTTYDKNTQLKDGQVVFLQYRKADGTLGDPNRDHVGVYFGGYIIQNSKFTDNKINGATGYMSAEEYLRYAERNKLSITVGTVTPELVGVKQTDVNKRLAAEPNVQVPPARPDARRTNSAAGPTPSATTPGTASAANPAPPAGPAYVMPKFPTIAPKQFGQPVVYRGEALGIPSGQPGQVYRLGAVTPEALKYSQTAYGSFLASYKNNPAFQKLTPDEKIPRFVQYLRKVVGYEGQNKALEELATKLIKGNR